MVLQSRITTRYFSTREDAVAYVDGLELPAEGDVGYHLAWITITKLGRYVVSSVEDATASWVGSRLIRHVL